MANLNFQQPPRNIANSSINSRNGGGFPAISGHVTPTQGGFPSNAFGQSQQGQPTQLSPNRLLGGAPTSSAQTLSNSRSGSMVGQRMFSDRRPLPNLGGAISSMGSFMQHRNFGGPHGGGGIGNNYMFGNSMSETPPLLDLSEFPSLTNSRGQNEHALPPSTPMQPPGSKPYVGMVKQPINEQVEFTMSSEDFPALPGTQNVELIPNNAFANNHENTDKMTNMDSGMSIGGVDLQADKSDINDKSMKRGVQTLPNGLVTNIPASMVNNQFGMVGLLTFIRAAESDPNLVSLAMGQDLTALGLNLNSIENLYPSFGGPFSDVPSRPQDIDYSVPPEYLINASIKEKLSPVTLKKYKDDLLFYLFYTNVGDLMQLAAAAELHSRDWRYHTEEKIWITRVPGVNTYEKNGTTERGTFYYFDAQNWRRVPKEFQIDTQKLDKCPNLTDANMSPFFVSDL